jgi:hypothetical protein
MARVNLHAPNHRLAGSAPDLAAEFAEQLARAADTMHAPGWQRGLLTAACDVLELSLQLPLLPGAGDHRIKQHRPSLPMQPCDQSPIAKSRS